MSKLLIPKLATYFKISLRLRPESAFLTVIILMLLCRFLEVCAVKIIVRILSGRSN